MAETGIPVELRDGVRVIKRHGIYTDENWGLAGVSAQFTEDADVYRERRPIDFGALLDRCLTLAEVEREASLRVLDVGAGSGDATLSATRLLPNATVVACDISPQLLSHLVHAVGQDAYLRGRVTPYCFDLHVPFFAERQFDLMIGLAILHHLTDPLGAMQHVTKSLKPGGKLVLVEPLEAGCMLLSTMYARVLAELRTLGDTEGPLVNLMHAMRIDLAARLGVPRKQPWTDALDDKWVFDEPYLSTLSSQLGFARVDVFPAQQNLEHLYEGAFRSLLVESGNAHLDVPQTVFDVFRQFDRDIAPQLKRRLCPTGIIVFSQSGDNMTTVDATQWRRDDSEYGTDPHYRTKYAVPMPNAALRDASSLADLGMFLAIGEAWAQVALHFMPTPSPVVADIGCGCGKMARFLICHPHLRYIGLDVFEPALAWCRQAFSEMYADRTQFIHLDVHSALYNPHGTMRAEAATLPLTDASVDFVICGSLFTHLLESEMVRYLAEIARILRPGGRMLASIHIEPAAGTEFSGNVFRIDMAPARFLRACEAAGMTLLEDIGNLYGQQAYIIERR